jgi:hypothetical protein
LSDVLGAQLKGKTQFQAIIPKVLEGAIILLLAAAYGARAVRNNIDVRQIKGCALKDQEAI